MTPGRIFFSYSRQDAEAFALKLASDLRAAGANVWIDQLDITPGRNWDEEIERALNESKYILFIASEKSVTSQNVLNEIYYAVDENKTVIPIRMHSCTIPFRIRRFQYIDFTGDYNAAFNKLVRHLDLQVNNENPARQDAGKSSQTAMVDRHQATSRAVEGDNAASPTRTPKRNRLFIAMAAIVLAAIVVFSLLNKGDGPDTISSKLDTLAAKVDSPDVNENSSALPDTVTKVVSERGAATQKEKSAKTQSVVDESENAEVDVEAKYPGGRNGWIQYLKNTLKYPEQARREKLQGTVFVRFSVDSAGVVGNITAVDGPMGGGLRKEAIRIIQNSGRWEPAVRNGRKVTIYKRISVPFQLQD